VDLGAGRDELHGFIDGDARVGRGVHEARHHGREEAFLEDDLLLDGFDEGEGVACSDGLAEVPRQLPEALLLPVLEEREDVLRGLATGIVAHLPSARHLISGLSCVRHQKREWS